MITSPVHVEAVLGQVDVVVVVDALSCTSQPTITLLVESTWVAVVFAADTANDVVKHYPNIYKEYITLSRVLLLYLILGYCPRVIPTSRERLTK